MMGRLIKGKPSKSNMMDALGIAAIKAVEERLLAPFIGNGTIQSGIVKGIVAFVLPTVAGSNKWTNLGATAFMIDAAEDLVHVGMEYVGGAVGTEGDVI